MVKSTKRGRKFGDMMLRTVKNLNHQFNNYEDRREAAILLVNHIIEYRKINDITDEEITLIGYSHGGNVETLAAQMLFDRYNVKANIITINTPAYGWRGDPENALENTGINDMITFWTPEDQVAGGLAPFSWDYTPANSGDNAARPTPNAVYPLINREVLEGWYSDHYLENVDPKEIRNSNAKKLKPVPDQYKNPSK